MQYLKLVSRPHPDNDQEASEGSRDLYDILVTPIEPLLDNTKLICIVPDKILNYLPFGALVSPETGAYLTENYLFVLSHSSTIFEACSETAAKKADNRDEKLLVVANPSFDRKLYPQLSDLPDAAREAGQIRGHYQGPVALTAESAVKFAVLRELSHSDVAHFATHSIIDDFSSLRSKLVMAAPGPQSKDRRAASAIESLDIYRLKLARPRLVVLSSCESAIERYYRGEGAISLARPFIAAGVPLVVASLWKVDSAASADLMIAFHKYRKVHDRSSVEALRLAQLEMIRGRNGIYSRPFYWAAFVAYGGAAPF
jgi:CHAT domain-containing protein